VTISTHEIGVVRPPPATYRIRVAGVLGEEWTDRTQGTTVRDADGDRRVYRRRYPRTGERVCDLRGGRLSTDAAGNVIYQLKHPFRDGTTHILFTAEDFLARLAALVPRPRANLTRYHGVFAPN
jgi:hypothetical protein